MSRMRERHRKDGNHDALVALAKLLGAQWEPRPPLDGWIGVAGKWLPVEIKEPARKGKPDEFTDDQISFFNRCRMAGTRWLVWYREVDVFNDIKGLSK